MLGLDFLYLTKKLQVSQLVQVVVNLINQRNEFLLSIIIQQSTYKFIFRCFLYFL